MTDLIDEIVESSKYGKVLGDMTKKGKYGLVRYDIDILPKMSKDLKKAVGHYTTINCSKIFSQLRTIQNYVAKELSDALASFLVDIKKKPKVLVVGLGNGNMIADSLGVATVERLLITGGLPNNIMSDLGDLSYIEPKVRGITGISSFDIVSGVVSKIKPDVIFAIDTLCANDIKRLACSFQISNAGISPGAGVGNKLRELSQKTLDTLVIAIGVPLIIGGQNINIENKELYDYDFTIKEIDYYIRACANVIARAINIVVHGDKFKKYI